MKYSIILILWLVLCSAYAAEWHTIQGTYAITGEHLIDPDLNEKSNTHLRLTLNGQTAKDLYDALAVQPKVDECTKQLAKAIDNMICYQGQAPGEYECHFSINIVEQSIEYGVVC